MNISSARSWFGLLCTPVVPSTIPGASGPNKVGFDPQVEDFSTADVVYVTQLAGITDTVNPTIVLATGVCVANGATITGSDGEDLYNVAIPTISLGYVLAIKRTDSNGGVLSITGSVTGNVIKLSAGDKVMLWSSAPIVTDTLTFDNSTSAAATVQICPLGRDAA